jgi:uncharacterized protein YbjT (DUF2867 family)
MPHAPMTIAVDGAETFLGRAIAKNLVASGNEVRAVLLSEIARPPAGCTAVHVPPGDDAALMRALSGASAVVMARKLLEEDRPAGMTFAAVHVARTRAFLDAAHRAQVGRFAFIGLARPERATPAAMTKAEDEVEMLLTASPIPALYVRTSLVVGRRDGHVAHLDRKARRGGPVAIFIGQGWARSAPLGARDFARCVTALICADEFRTGEIAIAGPERLTAMEILERLSTLHGRTKICVHLLESVARMGVAIAEKLCAKPPLSLARMSWLIENRLPETNAARELLGRFPDKFESAFGAERFPAEAMSDDAAAAGAS